MMVLTIVIGVIAAWFMIALVVALVVGRAAALGERAHRRMTSTRTSIDRAARLPERVA